MRPNLFLVLLLLAIVTLIPAFGEGPAGPSVSETSNQARYLITHRGGQSNSIVNPEFLRSSVRPMKYFMPIWDSYLILEGSSSGKDSAGNGKIAISLLEGKIRVSCRGSKKPGIGLKADGDYLPVPNIGNSSKVALSSQGNYLEGESIFGEIDKNSVLYSEIRPYLYETEILTSLLFAKMPIDAIENGKGWSHSIKSTEIFKVPNRGSVNPTPLGGCPCHGIGT